MSVPKPLVRSGLRLVRPMLDSPSTALGTKRTIVDRVVSLSRAPEGHIYDFDTIAGMDVQYVTMEANTANNCGSTILYLHGGGTVAGSGRAYRAFAANVSLISGMDVIIPEYPLAPESPYPAALDALLELYRELPQHGFDYDSLVIAGDASGAGLALSLVMRARDENLPMPSAIGMISPWLDMATDIYRDREPGSDPMLTPSMITSWALPYVGRHDPEDPGISPLRGDISGLPAIVVHYAGNDPLRSDAEALLESLVDMPGAPRVISREYPDMWHGFHLMAGRMGIADDAVIDFGESLRSLVLEEVDAPLAEVVPINRPVAERGGHLRPVIPASDVESPTAQA
jgi:monoterpene epsilon-lactone hydrolase